MADHGTPTTEPTTELKPVTFRHEPEPDNALFLRAYHLKTQAEVVDALNRGRDFLISDMSCEHNGLHATGLELVEHGYNEFIIYYRGGTAMMGAAVDGPREPALPRPRLRLGVDEIVYAEVWNSSDGVAEVKDKLLAKALIRPRTTLDALKREAAILRESGVPMSKLRKNEELNELKKLALKLTRPRAA